MMGYSKVTFVLYDGSYGRVSYSLSMAMVALAKGMEVHMLFTHGALRRLVKGHLDDLGGGDAREIDVAVEKGVLNGSLPRISETLRDARRLGLKIYACPNGMALLNISRDELVSEVDKVLGLSTFLDFVEGSIAYFV